MVSISHLEWHVAHACNFTCENCCHFSNHGHSVPVTYEQIEQWYDSWAHRIAPKTIDILGREVNKIPNNIIIEIYDDGSSKKRIIID